MKKFGRLSEILFSSALAISSLGCAVSSSISPEEEIRILRENDRGYIVGFEGLGAGGFNKGLTDYLSSSSGVVSKTSAGNEDAHMNIIRKTYAAGKPVYIVAHSLGCGVAERLIEKCENEGIEIEAVFLLDATFPGKIHSSARNFYDIKGTEPYIFRGRPYGYGDIEDANRTRLHSTIIISADHFNLPERAREVIRKEIQNK